MTDYITREVPLDRLTPPPFDVRERRNPDAVKELAGDMDRNGQLQAAMCSFGETDEYGAEELADMDLEEVYEDTDVPVTVIDGWTRHQAAELLQWPTLRCEIHADLQNAQAALSLSANTQRIEMRDYEELRALAKLRDQADMTLAELGQAVGYHKSTLSKYLGALEADPDIVAAWKNPDQPVELGHVLALQSVESQLAQLADSEDFPLEAPAARELSEEVQQLYLQETIEYDRSVSYLREMIDEDLLNRVRQRLDQRGHEDQIADGQTQQARQATAADAERDSLGRPVDTPREGPGPTELSQDALAEAMCLIHGGEADREIAVTVCGECAGVLQTALDQRVPLINALDHVED